jgi:hypothetical protein
MDHPVWWDEEMVAVNRSVALLQEVVNLIENIF